MTDKPAVLVLLGGASDEREVSLRSGTAVVKALEQSGYAVETYDPADGQDGLIKRAKTVDVVFPVLHGLGGEDGVLQAVLEAHSVPFVGSDSATSDLCFDKWKYKLFMQGHGFRVPDGELVDAKSYTRSGFIEQPYVLKPYDGGSSIDTFIVRDPSQTDTNAIQEAFTRHERMLIEQLIAGTEITMAVLDDQALPVIEIIPPKNQEFDYDNKYNGATQEICPPKNVPEDLQSQARDLSLTIHTETNCKGMSRTDMIIDSENQLWVLETNTIPGLTDQSLLPKAAATAGISMPELVDRLVRSALGEGSRG